MPETVYYQGRRYIGKGFNDWGSRKCMINALQTLIDDPQSILFLEEEDYKLIGVKTEDSRVIRPPLRILQAKSYLSNESRFNFGIRSLKDVKVFENGIPEDKKMWRSYVFIRDGELNIPGLKATLSPTSFKLFQDAGAIIDESTEYARNRIYKVSFEGMRLVSHCWAQPHIMGLVALMREEKELEAEQRIVNKRIKELGKPEEDEEEIIYHGETQLVEEEGVEYYEAPCVEYRLMKYEAEEYDYAGVGLEEALDKRSEIRRRLKTIRFLQRTIVFAYETRGNGRIIQWGDPKITKFGKKEQLVDFQGAQLKRVTWTEQVARTPK